MANELSPWRDHIKIICISLEARKGFLLFFLNSAGSDKRCLDFARRWNRLFGLPSHRCKCLRYWRWGQRLCICQGKLCRFYLISICHFYDGIEMDFGYEILREAAFFYSNQRLALCFLPSWLYGWKESILYRYQSHQEDRNITFEYQISYQIWIRLFHECSFLSKNICLHFFYCNRLKVRYTNLSIVFDKM